MLPNKRTPTHPGEVIQKEILGPLNLSQEELVRHLGESWTQSKLDAMVNKKRRITAAIALDLADIFGTTAEFWLNLQFRYDLWIARQTHISIPLLPAFQKSEKVNSL